MWAVGVGRDIFTNKPKQKQMTHKIDILMHNLVRIRKLAGILETLDYFPEIDSHYRRHDPVVRSAKLWQDSETRVSSLDWGLETPPPPRDISDIQPRHDSSHAVSDIKV